jgi:putative oxidoreductase
VVALLYLQHGLTKFLGFPGSAPSAMPLFPVILGGLIETFGSILLLIGLWTRPAALIMSGEMAIAYWYAHFPRSPFPYNNGGSLAILYCFVFLYIFFAGSGPWSIDTMWESPKRTAAA